MHLCPFSKIPICISLFNLPLKRMVQRYATIQFETKSKNLLTSTFLNLEDRVHALRPCSIARLKANNELETRQIRQDTIEDLHNVHFCPHASWWTDTLKTKFEFRIVIAVTGLLIIVVS